MKMKILAKKGIFSLILAIALIVILIILSGCSQTREDSNKTQGTFTVEKNNFEENTLSPFETLLNSRPTITPQLISPTRTLDPIYDLQITIEATQGPVRVITERSGNGEFLYNKAIATVWLGNDTDVFSYLNLDDLADNQKDNSDIQIEITTGSMSFYQLYPINNAVFFYTNEQEVDFNYCEKHFPLSGFTNNSYQAQGLSFTTGKAFCVLTNEGHIVAINYIKDSIEYNDDYSQYLSIQITVYNKIIE